MTVANIGNLTKLWYATVRWAYCRAWDQHRGPVLQVTDCGPTPAYKDGGALYFQLGAGHANQQDD